MIYLLYIDVHMGKIAPAKPLLILLYGMPGSGKTSFARQLCEHMQAAHVHGDRIRTELFQNPTYSKDENHLISSLMTYMAGEFLSTGVSVIYDTNAMRVAQRRALRNMAKKADAEAILIWFQIDADSAFARASKRNKRRLDDMYSAPIHIDMFRQQLAGMQNPDANEPYIVLSGKHLFSTQKNALLRILRERHLIDAVATNEQLTKPGLINIVPNPAAAGRVDLSRRNIIIR